jgi:Cu2+-exporting ATPase
VLAVLVVTCPCALSLATPAALAAATTRLARLGVLVTRADAIERLAGVDTVIMDKTGTLTLPATGIVDVQLLSGSPRDTVIAIAAALERGSHHPLAAAFREHEDPRVVASGLREVEGAGIEGIIAGETWRLGTRKFAAGPAHDSKAAEDATMYLGSDDGLVAAIRVGSPLRPEAARTVEALRQLRLSLVIASGDAEGAVHDAARALGITRAHSRLAPHDKIWLLEQLRASGHRVFAIGDGINDGPVLAAAHVSCAMGAGSAIAQSAADLLLVHDDLSVLPRAVAASRRALRVVRQNLGWSLAYNLAAVPAAALGLVSPWLAALGMSLSSLGVVLNARRLAGEEP